jgi:hypothetical protein
MGHRLWPMICVIYRTCASLLKGEKDVGGVFGLGETSSNIGNERSLSSLPIELVSRVSFHKSVL